MNKFIVTFVLVISCIFLSSCAPKTGVIQPGSSAYLWFVGNTENTVAILNDGAVSFKLKRAPAKKSTEPTSDDNLYKLDKSGKYNIKVMRNNVVIVNRTLLIGDGMIKEIMVP